jgi:hypothetical protein
MTPVTIGTGKDVGKVEARIDWDSVEKWAKRDDEED